MALAKKCDRCRKLYEHYPIGNQPGKFNAVSKVRRGPDGRLEYTHSAADMCPDCMASFERFMDGFEIVEVEKKVNKEKEK